MFDLAALTNSRRLRKSANARARRRSTRLHLETLEDRRLLAVGFLSSAGAAGGIPDGFSLGLIVTAGNDRLVTFQSAVDGNTVTGVTYGGLPMTLTATQTSGSGSNARLWTLPLGSGPMISSSFVVSTTGSAVGTISGAAFSGVNQVTPIDDTSAGSVAIGASSSTLNVSSEPGDMVLDAITATSNVGFPSLTQDLGQITIVGGGGGGGGFNTIGGASRKAGASPPVSMGWTISGNLPTEIGAHVAANINQVHPAEMNVTGNGMSIADGDTTPSPSDHTDFGSADIATGMVTRTFTVQNLNGLGDAPLNLTGTPRVQLSGAGAGSFAVTMLPSATVAAAGSTTFQVQFDPSTTGTKSATVSIANSDSNENPYNFAIQGLGTADANVSLAGGVLTVTGGTIGNGLTIDVSGGNLRIAEANGTLGAGTGTTQFNNNTVTVPLASVTSVVVNGEGGDDTLSVSYSGGNPIPAGGLQYHGGANGGGGDELALTGGSATTITHTLANASDGSVNIDGSTIMYTGLEPVTDNMSAVNRVFTFTGGTESISVTDGIAADGMTMIDSTLGESVYFANPTASLTINAGTGNDTVTISSVDAGNNASLTIDGGVGDDIINQNVALSLGSGAAPAGLTFIAETINLNANISTDGNATAGNVTLTGSVVLGADLTIDTNSTSDGNVTFNGTVDGAQSLTIDAGSYDNGGTVTFTDVVGNVALSSLSVVADVTLLNGGAITTTGLLELEDTNILLDSPVNTTSLTSTMGGNVILGFANSPYLRGAVDGQEALIVNTSGLTELDARIGEGGQRLSSITTDAPGTLSIDAVAIITTGSQTYNDATAFLQNSLTATSSSGGSISFAGTLDENMGAFASNLTINTTGPASFGGVVGQTTPLDSVTVSNSSTTSLAAAMTSVGNVQLTASSHITQTAGLITSSAGGVHLNAGGNVTTTGITAAANTVNGNTGAIKIDAAGTVNVDGPLTATSAGGLHIDIDPVDVDVNDDITATGDIDIVANNDVTIAGSVTIEADSDNIGGMSGGTLTIIADFDDDVDDGTGGTLLANPGSNLLGAIVFLAGDLVTIDDMTGKVDDAQILADVDAALTGAAMAADDVLMTALLGNVVIAVTASVMATDDVELDADGTVDINGPITAGEDVEIQTGFADQDSVFIDANITADGNVVILPDEIGADVLIGSGAIITSDADMSGGEDIFIFADNDVIQSSGSLVSNTGAIVVLTFFGDATIVSAVSNGSNQIAADFFLFGTAAVANASGDAVIQIWPTGDATVTGVVATAGDVEIVSDFGDVNLGGIAAGSNTVFIQALSGEIVDTNAAAINVTAAALSLDAAFGIGGGNAIETDLGTLSAYNSATGNIEVSDIGANANTLTIGTVVDQIPGVNNLAGGGEVIVSNASPLTVAANVSAVGDVTLTAGDSAAAGDDLTVNAGVSVISSAGNILLTAGDNADINGDLLATTGTITINVDPSMGDPDVVGGTIDIDAASIVTTSGGAFLSGGDDNDTFNFAPRTTSSFTVDGNPPVFGDPGVPPGDTLNLDLSALVNPAVLTLGPTPGSGVFSFIPPDLQQSVSFTSIETVNSGGTPFHLVLDMRLAGFQNGMDDLIEAELDGSGTNLLLIVNGSQHYEGAAADILSLTVIGSNDDDSFQINETAGGLPSFSGPAPPVNNTGIGGGISNGGHLNASMEFQLDSDFSPTDFSAADVSIHFDGSTGDNGMVIDFSTTHAAAYFSDTVDTANSGNIASAVFAAPSAPDLLLSFANLAPINFVGAGGGLLVDATSTPLTDELTIDDDGTPGDGVSIITGNNGFEDTSFSGFDQLVVRGGGRPGLVIAPLGGETLDLVALDSATTLTSVVLDGDNTTNDDDSWDTLHVRSTPAGVAVTLLGGLGWDTFQIHSGDFFGVGSNTVDGIQGTVNVSPTSGSFVDNSSPADSDTLLIDDQADASGDTVNINAATIDGLFDAGTGVDITYNADNLDFVVLQTTAGNDILNLNFMNAAVTDLQLFTAIGFDGDDTFNFLSSTPPAAVTALLGAADHDHFVFSDGALLTGTIDGGSQDDLIDWSAVSGPITVALNGLGPIDGYRGDELSTIDSGVAPDGFTNIDAVLGSASNNDTLEMAADLRTHWDIGGTVSGFGPFGAGGATLTDSLADTGVLIADEADLSLTGNALFHGRPEGWANNPQSNPIAPNAAGEADLAWASFENLTGAENADDRFDLRNGASISGTIDGRGHDANGDSIDYRDWTSPVMVNLGSPDQSFRTATNVGNIAPGAMGDPGNSIENVFGGNSRDVITGDWDDNILGDGHGSDSLDGGWLETGVPSPEAPAPEDDISGNDTFLLEPGNNENGTGGSSDVIRDLNGNDTVDFRFADARMMIDMDLLDVPQDVLHTTPEFQYVTLARRTEHVPISPSMFENVVGSQFNDIIAIDPLAYGGDAPENGSPVPRNVHGNDPFIGGPDDGNLPDPNEPIPPGDTLLFEGSGQEVLDTGFSITAAGIGTVTYQSIETLLAPNQRPRIIDNGDAQFLESPITATDNISPLVHWNQAFTGGYQDDYLFHYSQQPPGPQTTTWTFQGVQPGKYRVAVTWPSQPSHPISESIATDAPFTVFDDDFKLATIDVNQFLPPGSFDDEGVPWQQLGIFNISSHTLVVQLSDLANGQVLADAVRIERLTEGPELTVLAGTGYLDDGSSTVEMLTTVGNPLIRQFTVRNDGTATLVIHDIDLTAPGEVSPTTTPPNLTLAPPAPGFPLMIAPGNTFTFTVTLNALTDPFPGDPNRDGHGDFPGEIRIFSNDLDEDIIAKIGAGVNPNPDDDPLSEHDPFTFQIRGVVDNRTIIDNGDAGFQLVGIWPGVNDDGFQDDLVAAPADNNGERALWTFNNLPDGIYRVSTTFAADTEFFGSTAAPFTVSDINGQIGATAIDQSMAPQSLAGSFQDEGVWWVDLGGPYTVTGGQIVVRLLDTVNQPTRFILADAVRIERLLEDKPGIPFLTTRPDVTVEDGMADVADDTGVVEFGPTWPGTPVNKTFTIRNDGGAPLVVREPVSLPPGFTLLDFIVPAGGTAQLPTGMTQFTLMPGDDLEMRVRLDAGYPGTFDGELSFPTGDLAMPPASADPDETPFNFRLIGTVNRWQIIDDQDASGFSATSGFELASQQGLGSAQGFNSDVHFVNADDPMDPMDPDELATWTFD
ncbi:MAG: choice-of-anchor D domain-containing protein, partial [Pirellulaceae bacterium]|nr:choice-of-anchor D domain-containing protein [Pirellulaceae bacterium]